MSDRDYYGSSGPVSINQQLTASYGRLAAAAHYSGSLVISEAQLTNTRATLNFLRDPARMASNDNGKIYFFDNLFWTPRSFCPDEFARVAAMRNANAQRLDVQKVGQCSEPPSRPKTTKAHVMWPYQRPWFR